MIRLCDVAPSFHQVEPLWPRQCCFLAPQHHIQEHDVLNSACFKGGLAAKSQYAHRCLNISPNVTWMYNCDRICVFRCPTRVCWPERVIRSLRCTSVPTRLAKYTNMNLSIKSAGLSELIRTISCILAPCATCKAYACKSFLA